MSEKLASSEIAQSRERNMNAVQQSEKMWEKHFSKAAPELSKKGMFCYGYESGFAAAEGDTRELKAALRKLLNVAQGLLRGESYDMAGPKFIAIFAEAERLLG